MDMAVSIKLSLQKQEAGWVWPVGYSLPIPSADQNPN